MTRAASTLDRLPVEVPNRFLLLPVDALQFDVKNEHPLRSAWPRVVAVCELLWDPKAHLVARLHQLDALGPPFNDLIQTERGSLATRDRAVEHFSVGSPPGVMNLYVVAS